ncbi:peptidase M48 [Chitinimonas prasina]|uniref:Peptidase M48 n=1 Tax=Chitinimonas prasina TaxID=1434937 RepID=A0ABQ5YGK5_9NEIS|nr:M48 family metalloprotease [Chitinimonas prasina]GLR14136.1 peptidase M48 [Chitinimonas prasina]
MRKLILPLLLAFAAPAQAWDVGKLIKGLETAKKVVDANRDITEAEEVQMGGELAATLLGAAPLVDDAEMQRYVNRVGVWLALHSERPGLPWKFGVIDHPHVNAFATPGGHVLVTRGLLQRLRSEAELAGVLAHEIAHVLKKHQLSAIQKSLGTAALSDIAAQYADNTGKRSAANTAKLIGGGKELYLKGLDKEDEYEADRMGVVIAARAGYNPYGLVGVLQTLSESASDPGLGFLLETHPMPNDRLDRLEVAMGERMEELSKNVDNLPRFSKLRR